MTFDPNWQVRYQALSHVAFSKMTLPDIIDRVRDQNANVRRKALLILSEKVLIKFISIEKRLFILNYSLKDEDPSVLETCCKRLLPSWLAFKENDLCKLLKALDVVQATETMELMLDKMYTDSPTETLCNEFCTLLNEKLFFFSYLIVQNYKFISITISLFQETLYHWISWMQRMCFIGHGFVISVNIHLIVRMQIRI
jgi:hypothetical protein